MLHWLANAFDTYVLHVQNRNGYQFWSGFGSDLGEATLILVILRHVNCNEKGCYRFGYRHPDHGRPVCHKHYNSHKPPLDVP